MHTGWSTGVEYMANAAFSGYQRNSCGYCKSENGSMSHLLPCPYTHVNDRSIDSAKALLITVAPSRSVRSITMSLWIGVGEGRTLSFSSLWFTSFPWLTGFVWCERSGTIYYKPNLPRSCCPHYTIRLEASEFKARRDQRKAINSWNKFVLGPEYIRKAARLCPKTRE